MKRTVHPRVCRVLVAAVFLALTGAAGAQTQATPDEEFKKHTPTPFRRPGQKAVAGSLPQQR